MAKEYYFDMSESEFIGIGNSEAYEYDRVRNQRTDIRNGIRVNVVDRPHGYQELSVHLPGQTLLLWPDGVEPNDEIVSFTGLKVRPYVSNGRIQYSATAESAQLVGDASKSIGSVVDSKKENGDAKKQ